MKAAGLVVLAFLGVGCEIPVVPCEALAARLEQCDLSPSQLRCDRLSPESEARLASLLDSSNCEKLRDSNGMVDARACEAFGWDCPSALGTEPERRATQYPIVFVGGIDGRDAFDWNEALLEKVRTTTGARVLHARLPGWASTQERANALFRTLLGVDAEKVNLICYAVGGMDCRYMVSPAGLFASDDPMAGEAAGRVASITTVATPHRGTEVATAALSLATDEVAGDILRTLTGSSDVLDETLRALTPEEMRAFNERVGDAEGVFYQSYAGVSHVLGQALIPTSDEIDRACVGADNEPLFDRHDDTYDAMSEPLWVTAPFAVRAESEGGQDIGGPSDGMVSVESAKWGAFRGCIPADHYDVIGQFGDEGPDPRTGFDSGRFYSDVVNDLARRGF